MHPSNHHKLTTCSTCGQSLENSASPIEVHSETGETRRRCAACLAKEYANSITTVEQADRLNTELEDLIARVDRLIEQNPDTPTGFTSLAGLAATPLNSFRTLLIHLAEVQSRRQEILAQDGSEARLAYEIRQAVAEEDYERAAELKGQREHAMQIRHRST
ncbi:MAG: hypothetical protein KF851_05140 [Pirellulaceae bacterium]|nr:hypothetical protein [Pirellulaceae bacterium]